MQKSNKNHEILQHISVLIEELRTEDAASEAPSDTKTSCASPCQFELISHLYEMHRARSEAFGREIFKDTAWQMLLEVFRMDSEGRQIHVSALCAASRRSQTTALRFLADLEAARLIAREADSVDRRRTYVTLTDEARRAMQHIERRLAVTV